jgi:hypothetical protein
LLITCAALVFILDAVLFLPSASPPLSSLSLSTVPYFYIRGRSSLVLALYERNPKVFLVWIPILLPFAVAACLVGRNAFGQISFNLQCDVNEILPESVSRG